MSILAVFLIIVHWLGSWFTPILQLDLVRILSPQNAEVLQGNVAILGTVTGVGLQYSEISFQYQENADSEWFLITRFDNAVIDDILVNWETSSIADGTYQLRLVAHYSNGHELSAFSEQLRIRNYTPIETVVFPPVGAAALPQTATASPTNSKPSTPFPTTTIMPANDLSLSLSDLGSAAKNGAIIGMLLLLIFGISLIIRRRRIG